MGTTAGSASTMAVATMPEPVGRSARWGTVAVVAPLAAAALAVATSWGVAHPPGSSGTAASTGQESDAAGQAVADGEDSAGLDKTMLALEQAATSERARVLRLQKILHRLQARTRAVSRAPLSGGGGGYSTPLTTVGGAGGGTVAAPPRVSALAPAPATHTSTGAS
jgi:hypothetical protein